MRIDALNQINPLYKTTKPKKPGKAESAEQSDMLEISRMGRDYQVAKQAVREAPDIREDRVNEIKAALEAGTYSVSARDVADKMVESYYGTTGW